MCNHLSYNKLKKQLVSKADNYDVTIYRTYEDADWEKI